MKQAEKNGCLILKPGSKVKAADTDELSKELANLEKDGCKKIVVDLSSVKKLPLDFLLLIISASYKYNEKIAFSGLKEDLLLLIRNLGIREGLNIYSTASNAAKSVQGG